jgi:hypothetical protein
VAITSEVEVETRMTRGDQVVIDLAGGVAHMAA